MAQPKLVIAGGGPTGSLLAIFLARRGFAATVIERSEAYSADAPRQGRSINLALAARGIEALRAADVHDDVASLLLPMRGRMIHEAGTQTRFLRYGRGAGEQIYSLSRSALNETLCRVAQRRYGIEYLFGHECTDVDLDSGLVLCSSPDGDTAVGFDILMGADGAGSAVRRALHAKGIVRASEDLLDHGYKELSLPADPSGAFALTPADALHIWPRGQFMLIALPNLDRSFTATLFLPLSGTNSFKEIDAHEVANFFAKQFPDAQRLMPELAKEFVDHPVGTLGTVSCTPWSDGNRVLLLGDAAHAIVPFHGQGMNAAFEDCLRFDRLLAAGGRDWGALFRRFEAERRGDTRAIAEMALENYLEMRDRVRDPDFELRSLLAFELERRFPDRFVPRYSMVMFHPEIGYAEAQRRGRVQSEILDRLTAGCADIADVDFELARRLIGERL